MLQCPSCKRKIANNDTCPRCGLELGDLQKIVARAQMDFIQGCKYLAAEEYRKALKAFRSSYKLHHTPHAGEGIIAALICQGLYKEALLKLFSFGYSECAGNKGQ